LETPFGIISFIVGLKLKDEEEEVPTMEKHEKGETSVCEFAL
jgi:hypothetical protein